ncbi:MAG: MBL fold metallo-hydrolase [Candidatus Heimdallarchaeota archaeon]|nr:MBL fold metallo-hydrolase [Candidatus Heimdallarchaeota archaeon]MBY8994217.1 MBL fold metallo-hydrolase [Candidatus Heimdallarchaeota archaeon]
MSKWPYAIPRESNKNLEEIESISNWFVIYRLNKDTFALLEPFHYEEVVSYLLIGEEKALLFDTGMGVTSIKLEVEALTKKELIVLNSHSHYDHVGGNHEFSNVWAFENDFEIQRLKNGDYSQKRLKNFDDSNICADLPSGFDRNSYHIKPSIISRRIKHLERINLGNRELLIHHTPGHSPASICIQDFQYQLLFTGDTLYPGEMYLDLEGSDFNTYYKSMNYLNDLFEEVLFLCPGHNEALISKDYLRDFKNACEKVKSIIPQNPSHRNIDFGNFSMSF